MDSLDADSDERVLLAVTSGNDPARLQQRRDPGERAPREWRSTGHLVAWSDRSSERAEPGPLARQRRCGEPTVVEVLMHRLRRKIERPGRPPTIQTVRGEGYIIRDHEA